MVASQKWKDVASWILKSKDGQRFARWFVLRHGKELLGSVGALVTDYVERWILSGRRRHAVVLEIHPDGFVQVFGKDVSVVVVNRLVCPERVLWAEEEYHRQRLRGDHQAIYGDARYMRASANVERVTLAEEMAKLKQTDRIREEVAWRRIKGVLDHPHGFLIRRAVHGSDWDTTLDDGTGLSHKITLN